MKNEYLKKYVKTALSQRQACAQKQVRLLKLLLVVLTAIIGIHFNASAQTAADFAAIRNRCVTQLTGGTSIDLTDPVIRASATAAGVAARNLRPTVNPNLNPATATYVFAGHGTFTEADMNLCYDRLKTMALGYATVGTDQTGNDTLKRQILFGLDWLVLNWYNSSKPLPLGPGWGTNTATHNWFNWDIYVPLDFTATMAMMYPVLTATEISNYDAALDYFDPTTSGYVSSDAAVNLAWVAQCIIVRGAVGQTAAKVADGRTGILASFEYVTPPTAGFATDGSYTVHSGVPFTDGYGSEQIGATCHVVDMLNASSFYSIGTSGAMIYKWIFDSFQPAIYKGAGLSMLMGRYISRASEHNQGGGAMSAILFLLQNAPTTNTGMGTNAKGAAYPANPKLAMQQMLKYWWGVDNVESHVPTSIFQYQNYKALINNTGVTAMAEPVEDDIFPLMDRVIHFRPGWAFATSMSSSRIFNYESINGENLKGYHTGDGMTYIYNGDLTQYDASYWYTVNSFRLPGTTHELNATTTQGIKNDQDWVGGTNLSTGDGTAGMSLHVHNLFGKKSWFMFNNAVVALGAGITDADAVSISTTVDNKKLKSDNSNVFSFNGTAQANTLTAGTNLHNVTSLHLTGNSAGSDIGYAFYDPALTVTYSRSANSGTPTDIGGSGTTSVTNNFLAFYVGHGTAPVKQKYAYAILPGMTAAQTATYASSPDVFVLRNDDSVQAVKQTSTNTVAANFWRYANDSVNIGTHPGFIFCNKAASIMLRQTSTQIEIAVSDPTQTFTGDIFVEIKTKMPYFVSKDPAISVHQWGTDRWIQFRLAASGLKDKTQRVIFSSTSGTPFTAFATPQTMMAAPLDSQDQPFSPVLFPNPTSSGEFNVAYYAASAQLATLTVYDARGLAKQSQKVQLVKGKNTIGVNGQQLPKGNYYVLLVTPTETVKKQLIVGQ